MKLSTHEDEIIAALIGGEGPSSIARRYEVSPQAIDKFRKAHKEVIDRGRQTLLESTTEIMIADKQQRLAGYNADWHALAEDINEARDDEDNRTRDVVSMIAERRQLAMAAASELGQLPKADIKVGDTNTFILNVLGVDPRKELG